MRLRLLVWLCICLCAVHSEDHDEEAEKESHYLNSFVIKTYSRSTAERIARDYGFEFLEQLPDMDYYHLSHPAVAHRSKRHAADMVVHLAKDPRVKFVEQQRTLDRVKRSHILHDKQLEFPIEPILDNSKYFRVKSDFDTRGLLGARFNDEFYDDQWYLHNEEQTGGKRDLDLNVQPAWDHGFTGRGVVISVLDDGVDHSHPDIATNYEPRASADLNDLTDKFNDPMPDKSSTKNSHGTRCAGEIVGVANNGICGVGVAYNAKIGGVRLLDGEVTDSLEGRALLFRNQLIDIYSASWGPRDNGKRMEAPNPVTRDALITGVKKGRGGKGSIFIWASGNGGRSGDSCSADGYVSSIQSISIQSLSDQGRLPFFGERCSSTMAAVPTGGEMTTEEEINARYKIKVVTTDINGHCMENFEGTSGAAPLAAGCVALMLQANPDLTWRDVQHIIAASARISSEKDDSWIINGAGFHLNDRFGFGLLDCSHMVELAQSWINVPEQHTCQTPVSEVNSEIPRSGCHKLSFQFDGCKDNVEKRISNLEHVELHVVMTAERRGDMEIFLTSPSGTRSQMLYQRPPDDDKKGIDFTFMTVHNWMENPRGEWTIEACHKISPASSRSKVQGIFKSWNMIAYGFYDTKRVYHRPTAKTRDLDTSDLENIIRRESFTSRSTGMKRAQKSLSDGKRDNQQSDYVQTVKKLMDEFSSKFDSNPAGDFDQRNAKFNRKYSDGNPEFVDSYARGVGDFSRGTARQAWQQHNSNNNMVQLKRSILDSIIDLDDPKQANKYLREYLQVLNNDKRSNAATINKINYLLNKK